VIGDLPTLGRAASMRAPPGSRAPASAYSNRWRKPSLVSFPLPLTSRQLFVELAGLHCHRGRSGARPAQPGLPSSCGISAILPVYFTPIEYSSSTSNPFYFNRRSVFDSARPSWATAPHRRPQQPLPHCFAHHSPSTPAGPRCRETPESRRGTSFLLSAST
jgi:hypothetical protein